MQFNKTFAAGALVAVSGMCSMASAQSEQVLFFENFDDIALGQNVEEGILTGEGGVQDNVWTPDFPAGWSRDFNLPGVGVREWQGWHIADGRWWNFTCGDQDRSNFVEPSEMGLSRGGVAIADGDEWDDFDANGLDPDGEGLMQALMTTPAFDVSGVTAGSMNLSFFSSWRDEDLQTAVVEVRYDGGSWEQVLRFSSDDTDADFKDDSPNEIISIDLSNPSASSMEVRFSYLDGGNDWWWAVDTIQVTGERSGVSSNGPGYSFISAETFNDTASPIINIGAAAGADDYTVIFAKDADFTDVRATATAPASGEFVSPAILNGTYYVKAVANNAAGSRDSENSVRIVVDNPIFADIDGNGMLNFFDIVGYIGIFTEGCP